MNVNMFFNEAYAFDSLALIEGTFIYCFCFHRSGVIRPLRYRLPRGSLLTASVFTEAASYRLEEK